MEIEIAKCSKNKKLMVPCGESGRIAHRPQRYSGTQQEHSERKVNHVKFGEGSLDPSYRWKFFLLKTCMMPWEPCPKVSMYPRRCS
jgi:hypothetical protein